MGKLKKIVPFYILSLLVFMMLFSCQQQSVESKTTIEHYKNGQILREQVKYKDNDTTVAFIYFLNGKLNRKYQIVNSKRTGWSYTYDKKGTLLYQENYLNDALNGELKAFYTTGALFKTEHYQQNQRINTTTYYNTKGQITKKVAYLMPCDLNSCECNELITVYDNGVMVYAYEVINGIKTGKDTVYNSRLYKQLMLKNSPITAYEKGRTIFSYNCGMCHKIEQQAAGIGLKALHKPIISDELIEILAGSKGHPSTRVNDKEVVNLIEYINIHCP